MFVSAHAVTRSERRRDQAVGSFRSIPEGGNRNGQTTVSSDDLAVGLKARQLGPEGLVVDDQMSQNVEHFSVVESMYADRGNLSAA